MASLFDFLTMYYLKTLKNFILIMCNLFCSHFYAVNPKYQMVLQDAKLLFCLIRLSGEFFLLNCYNPSNSVIIYEDSFFDQFAISIPIIIQFFITYRSVVFIVKINLFCNPHTHYSIEFAVMMMQFANKPNFNQLSKHATHGGAHNISLNLFGQ